MHKKNLLIVDDEKDIREIFSLIYADQFNIITAESGNEAFEIYKETQIDVILTDLKMPNGDGSFLAESISNYSGKNPCPIFMMTANLEYDYVELLDKGVNVIFSKPFDFNQFLKVVDFYLRMKQQKNSTRKFPRAKCHIKTEIQKESLHDFGEMLDITPEGFLLQIPKSLLICADDEVIITVKLAPPSVHFNATAECRWAIEHDDFTLAGFHLKDSNQINHIINCFNHFQITSGEFR